MKRNTIALCLLIFSQTACQRTPSGSADIAFGEGLVSSNTPSANVKLTPQVNDRKLVSYETALLNSYLDADTRKVYNDVLIKSTLPPHEVNDQLLSNMSVSANIFFQMADSASRPSGSEINDIGVRYNAELAKIQSEYGSRRNTLQTFDMIGSSMSVYAGSTGAVLPAIGFELVKNSVVVYSQNSIDAAEAEAKDKASSVVLNEINKMSMGEMEDLSNIRFSSPEEGQKKAKELMDGLTNRLIPQNLSYQEKAALKASLGSKIAETTYNLMVKHKSTQDLMNLRQQNINEYQAARIDQAEKSFVGLTRTVNHFRQETKEKLSNLFETQEAIVGFIAQQGAQINNITKNLAEVDTRTKFMADFMFGKMTAGEQITALKSGNYGDPNSPAVKDLLQQKERIYQREKFQQELGGLITNVQNIAIIASRLGVDPSLVSKVSQGAAYADASLKAANAVMSGNYIGAALAVTGVFGGGGDPSAARHAEVMRYLHKLDMKLDSVISMQQATINLIKEVSEQIKASTLYLANRLNSVQYLQLAMNQTLESILNRDLNSCHIVRTSIDQEYNSSQADFLLNLTVSNSKALMTCADALETRLYVDGVSTKYNLATFLSVKDIHGPEAQEDYYQAVRDYILGRKSQKMRQLLVSLLQPVANYTSLKEKISGITSNNSEIERDLLHDRRLHPMAIIEDANLLLKLLPTLTIYQNQKVDGDLFSVNPVQLGYRQYKMILTSLQWINRSIAQENLLFGDVILPLLHQERGLLAKELNCGPDAGNTYQPYCLLKSNKVLRENYIVYALRRALDKKSLTTNDFVASLDLHKKGNTNPFETLLDRKFEIDYENDRIKAIVLTGEKIEVEKIVKRLVNGEFQFSPALPHLIEARNKLVEKLAEMRMNSYLTEAQRRYLTYKVFAQ